MPNVVYTPTLTAYLNGVQLDPATVLKARAESSLGDPVSKGYVTLIEEPSWAQGDEITIAMGSGTNNTIRFDGNVYEGDTIFQDAPVFEFVCRGPMWQVTKYRNSNKKGLTLQQLTGGPATDQAIAIAVLTQTGVDFDSANIGGTGLVRGNLAAVGYTWKYGESALEYLQRLAKASQGYAVVETLGSHTGQIFRVLITSVPTGAPDFTFTEGVDIFEGAHLQNSSFDQFTAWTINGFDYGDGLGPVSFSDPTTVPDGVSVYTYSSEMIEKALDSDPGGGISAQSVLAYVAGQNNHAVRTLSGLITPRDDLIGPGQVHSIDSARLGGTRSYTVRGVVVECDADWFTQTIEYVG